MQSQRTVPELDVHVTVRGDVAAICAVVLKPHFDLSGANVLEQEIAGFVSGMQVWSHDAYYRLGDQVFIHAQNLPRVLKHLKARGQWVELSEYKDWPQLSRATQANHVPGLASWEASAVQAVGDQPWGQILAARSMAPGMIAALVQFYNSENVLVVTKNAESVKHIARELRQRTNRHVSTGIEIARNTEPLVHIQPLSGLDRSGHDWPVLIFADAESARSDTGMRQAVSMPDSLIYAIVSTEMKLDQEDLLRLRVTCGPELYRLTDAPFTGTAVTVLLVRAKRKRRGSPRNPLRRKRMHLWDNDPRNQQVAELAEAFAAADLVTLGQLGVPVEALQQQLQDLGRQPRVAIVVESPNHARRLRLMLPEWQIAAGARLADKDLPMLPQECDRTILTLTRALAAGVLADVVIRADGTEQAWTWDLGPHYGLTGNSMIVVDLFDTFDAPASYAARRRRIDYAARDWKIIESINSRATANTAR